MQVYCDPVTGQLLEFSLRISELAFDKGLADKQLMNSSEYDFPAVEA